MSGSTIANNAQCHNLNVTGTLSAKSVATNDPIAFRIGQTTSLTLTDATNVPVVWSDAVAAPAFVSGGMVKSNSGVTVPVSGYYSISLFALTQAATNAVQYYGNVKVNGVSTLVFDNFAVQTNDTDTFTQALTISGSSIAYVNAGELISVELYQNSDGNIGTQSIQLSAHII